jgi:hypothetical protein
MNMCYNEGCKGWEEATEKQENVRDTHTLAPSIVLLWEAPAKDSFLSSGVRLSHSA